MQIQFFTASGWTDRQTLAGSLTVVELVSLIVAHEAVALRLFFQESGKPLDHMCAVYIRSEDLLSSTVPRHAAATD